jgi:hypothetical protein
MQVHKILAKISFFFIILHSIYKNMRKSSVVVYNPTTIGVFFGNFKIKRQIFK